jgi:hypothetical protein
MTVPKPLSHPCSLLENLPENLVIRLQALVFEAVVFFQQILPLFGQMGTSFPVGFDNSDLKIVFCDFDFTPDPFVRHPHNFGRFVKRTCLLDILKDFPPAFSNDDVSLIIDDPVP